MALADLAPLDPPQDAGCVEQHDLLDVGLLADVEPGAHRGREGLERARRLGDDLLAEACDHLLLEVLQDGAEQVALVGELVVERPPCDTGASDDLLGADAGVAALAEQLAPCLHQCGTCGLGPLDLGSLDIHAVCMKDAYSLYVNCWSQPCHRPWTSPRRPSTTRTRVVTARCCCSSTACSSTGPCGARSSRSWTGSDASCRPCRSDRTAPRRAIAAP